MTNVYFPHQQTQHQEFTTTLNQPESDSSSENPCAKYIQFLGSSHQERAIYVEKLIDMYANAIDTIFYTKTDANIKIVNTRAFIQTILKRSQSTFVVLQTSLFYLFRVKAAVKHISQKKDKKSTMESMMCCGRRMFLASLMTASKYLQDKNYRNRAWCQITTLPLEEINQLEIAFLKLIDYKLYVSKPTFDKWYTKLHEHIQSKITTPIVNKSHINVQTINQANVNEQQQQQHYNHNNNNNNNTHQINNYNMPVSPPASPIDDNSSHHRFGMPSPPPEERIQYTNTKRRQEQENDIVSSKKQCI